MLLNIEETARLLDVPEKEVLRWIRKGGLSASRIEGQFEINRMDLLEWATENGIKVPPELFAAAEDEASLPMPSLLRALETGGIHRDVAGDDRQAVLKNVVGLLPIPPGIDAEFLLQVLLAREALGSTAIGDGIAIPHVRNPILLHQAPPFIALCFLKKPIDFQALDGKPVRILFTLASPTVKSHLHMLSRLAFVLRNPAFKAVLAGPCDPAKILETVAALEKKITATRPAAPPG